MSTSKYGLGDEQNSYKTPVGKHKIASKHGSGAKPGTVFKYRKPTREIVKPNAPGRDPIVTRILRLRGLEKQNSRAYARAVYFHGTPEERNIGHPVTYGCVRMTSDDIIELYDQTKVGTGVDVTTERVGRAGDRISQLLNPVGKLIPGLGKLFDRTGKRVSRIVDPVEKVAPVTKILDGVDRGVLVRVEKVTRPDSKKSKKPQGSEETKFL